MNCLGCNRETIDCAWGNLCEACGGVVVGDPPRLFFRHVATVFGNNIAYLIVFDLSANAYGVAWPRKQAMVTCVHCGMKTPGDDSRSGLGRLDEMRTQQYFSKRGTLNEVLATIQPIASEEGSALPTLAPAPSATEDERKQLGAE